MIQLTLAAASQASRPLVTLLLQPHHPPPQPPHPHPRRPSVREASKNHDSPSIANRPPHSRHRSGRTSSSPRRWSWSLADEPGPPPPLLLPPRRASYDRAFPLHVVLILGLFPSSPGKRRRVADAMMDDYVSESDSDYTSYWRDWVSGQKISAHRNGRRALLTGRVGSSYRRAATSTFAKSTRTTSQTAST